MPLRITALLTTFLGAWLVVQSLSAAAAPRTAIPTVALMPEEAAVVSSVLGHAPLCTQRVEGTEHGRPGVGLVGPDFDAGVDKETGILTGFSRQGIGGSGLAGPPLLTSQQVQARAEAFLQRAGVRVEGVWTLKKVEYHEVGPGFRQYDLNWVRLFHGVQLPSLILMVMNADSGGVMQYALIDDPVIVPLQPNLTAEDAVRVLVTKKMWTHPIVRKAELIVWYKGGYPGPQALLWRVEAANPDAKTGSDSIAGADVDAVTGEIATLRTPLGFFQIKPHSADAKPTVLPTLDLKALRGAKLPPTVFQLAKMKQPK